MGFSYIIIIFIDINNNEGLINGGIIFAENSVCFVVSS